MYYNMVRAVPNYHPVAETVAELVVVDYMHVCENYKIGPVSSPIL